MYFFINNNFLHDCIWPSFFIIANSSQTSTEGCIDTDTFKYTNKNLCNVVQCRFVQMRQFVQSVLQHLPTQIHKLYWDSWKGKKLWNSSMKQSKFALLTEWQQNTNTTKSTRLAHLTNTVWTESTIPLCDRERMQQKLYRTLSRHINGVNWLLNQHHTVSAQTGFKCRDGGTKEHTYVNLGGPELETNSHTQRSHIMATLVKEQGNRRYQTSPTLCTPITPFPADRPHRLHAEYSGFLFIHAWRTEWSLLQRRLQRRLRMRLNGLDNPRKLHLPARDLHPHITHSSICTPESSSKTACQSAQPFLHSSP